MPDAKVATCCYCNRRTTLRATASDGHALACASCGAPLTRMKSLRPETARAAAAHPPVKHPVPVKKDKKKKSKKKTRKGMFHRLLEEAWDGLEDIFD
ncbi:hypothetical protein [Jannaschia sp. 2305UL9-9]|uniref:hypothetical protein n=1 Tax=Jannaschia sp. 2305UL9-9 TaxID=3121638 RepID=UPI0035283483